MSESPYNPLAIANIANSIVRELTERPCGALPPASRFFGSGIYALYYQGDYAGYADVRQANAKDCVQPIYVGKAVPQGGRKGVSVTASASSQVLFGRLSEHADSIRAANTSLRLEDFRCRYLVVEELFIELAERNLIQAYKPVWNACLGGFGNHDPGSGRSNQKRSGWDTLHPGRAWAARLQPNQHTADEWNASVISYLIEYREGKIGEVQAVDEGEGIGDS